MAIFYLISEFLLENWNLKRKNRKSFLYDPIVALEYLENIKTLNIVKKNHWLCAHLNSFFIF